MLILYRTLTDDDNSGNDEIWRSSWLHTITKTSVRLLLIYIITPNIRTAIIFYIQK